MKINIINEKQKKQQLTNELLCCLWKGKYSRSHLNELQDEVSVFAVELSGEAV